MASAFAQNAQYVVSNEDTFEFTQIREVHGSSKSHDHIFNFSKIRAHYPANACDDVLDICIMELTVPKSNISIEGALINDQITFGYADIVNGFDIGIDFNYHTSPGLHFAFAQEDGFTGNYLPVSDSKILSVVDEGDAFKLEFEVPDPDSTCTIPVGCFTYTDFRFLIQANYAEVLTVLDEGELVLGSDYFTLIEDYPGTPNQGNGYGEFWLYLAEWANQPGQFLGVQFFSNGNNASADGVDLTEYTQMKVTMRSFQNVIILPTMGTNLDSGYGDLGPVTVTPQFQTFTFDITGVNRSDIQTIVSLNAWNFLNTSPQFNSYFLAIKEIELIK